MHIDTYDFGKMVIDGKGYDHDVIVLQDRVIGNWWRKEGHHLRKEDLEEVIRSHPHLLVIGTGMHGFMQVPEETVKDLREEGIETLILKTREACKVFNGQERKKGVAAAFHLTC
jgi:hypothetical protein